MIQILHGDCLEKLKTLKDNSIDSMVTDPPAGISFMGKSWDGDKGGRKQWIAWMAEVMSECLRVLKPGGHALVWAIPRTSHWTATALEDAGFEIRDTILHCFGSGFPKSLDIFKAIDKAAGAEREVLAKSPNWRPAKTKGGAGFDKEVGSGAVDINITAPATDEAKQWAGYGTALKPAVEIWWLVRKPLSEKTVAANVLKWGVGGINIDASRIEASENIGRINNPRSGNRSVHQMDSLSSKKVDLSKPMGTGRFPANLVLSCSPNCTEDAHDMFCPIAMLDEQSGQSVSRPHKNKASRKSGSFNASAGEAFSFHCDTGGASRFFYCAKASKSDKGNDNTHPTVKSTKLMRYLVRMITPPGGLVLDPFLGSGSTGVAAKAEGFRFIGIEREQEYIEIARARLYLS